MVAPVIAGAAFAGARALAANAGRALLAEGATRFAGQALAQMGRNRMADAARRTAMRAAALERLPQPSTFDLIKGSLLPKGVGEAAMRFGPEVLSMGVMTAATGDPLVGLETSLYSLGGGFGGGALGGLAGAMTRGARRGDALRSHVGGAVTIGDFAGSLTGSLLPSQRMKTLEEQALQDQQLELAQRDDRVRQQTLQALQSPYASSPYSTSPFAVSRYDASLYG